MPEPFLNLDSPKRPDTEYIRKMFDGLAARYDIFTRLTGFGRAGAMRRETLRGLKPGMRVLDLGCGTGDLVLAAVPITGAAGRAVGLDFSENMLAMARHRYAKLGLPDDGRFALVHEKAESLPLSGEKFDLIVSGFVLRNLYANIDRILAGVRASLVPGGRIAFLDLTEPENAVKRALFRAYMFGAVGLYGHLLFGSKYPIPYLPDSAGRFLKTGEFLDSLKRAGFHNVRARRFMLGAVSLYEAERSA